MPRKRSLTLIKSNMFRELTNQQNSFCKEGGQSDEFYYFCFINHSILENYV